MAGTGPGGFAKVFRDAIHQAMAIGKPQVVNEGVTFEFPHLRTWITEDPAGNPYDWTATPTTDMQTAALQVPCAVQFSMGAVASAEMGLFDTSKVVLTLLDTDYAQVKDATGFVINDTHYVITAVGPPLGLFEVTVFLVHGEARG